MRSDRLRWIHKFVPAKSIFRLPIPTMPKLFYLPTWRSSSYYRDVVDWRSRAFVEKELWTQGSFIRRTINNAQRILRAIGAMCRLHPVSTLRCSRLTRQVQVPIVGLWIRETCSIPTSLHTWGEQLQNYDISRVTLTAATTRAYESATLATGSENFITEMSPFLFSYLSVKPKFCQIDQNGIDSEWWEKTACTH